MEERQTQIREQAGLTESRLSEDFIEVLRKYSSPALLILALVAGGFWAYRKYEQMHRDSQNLAYRDLELAGAGPNPSPDALVAVAEQHKKFAAVGSLARLKAADTYLSFVRMGAKPGSEIKPETGELVNPDDALSPQDRENYLDAALGLYKRVAADTAGNSSKLLMHVNALYGQAAVAECRLDKEGAKAAYQTIVTLLGDGTFRDHTRIAEERLKQLDQLVAMASPPPMSKLPKPPEPPPPATVPGATPEGFVQPPQGDVGPLPTAPSGEAPQPSPPSSDAPAPGSPGAAPTTEPPKELPKLPPPPDTTDDDGR